MRRPLFFSLLLAFLTLGGSLAAAAAGPEDTVRRYVDLLAAGYRDLDMTPLQAVATPEEAGRVYHHMAALAEGRVRLDSTLLAMTTTVTALADKEATVTSNERWRCRYLSLEDGEERLWAVVRYHLTYRLTRQHEKGAWLVAAVTVDEAVEEERHGELPFLQRPGGPRLEGGGR